MDKKRLKIAYVPPQTEVCAAEPHSFWATSLSGGAGDGEDDGEINGAKKIEFFFDDPWEDLKM